MPAPFKKGHHTGRPKGALNKKSRMMKELWADSFYKLQEDPAKSLLAWARENPREFYKLAIRLLPLQTNVDAVISLDDVVINFK